MALPRAHLRFAVRVADRVPAALGAAVRDEPDAFYAGAVAPDARAGGRVPREATHFYAFDRRETWGLATRRLFESHPDLGRPNARARRQAAYTAGFISHLAVDEVFAAFLGPSGIEGDGDAILGLTYTIEDDWRATGAVALPAALALERFRAGRLVTIVDADDLDEIVRHAIENMALDAPGRFHRVLADRRGRPLEAVDADREARGLIARAHQLFGEDVARRFAAAAERETETRLAAFATGAAARYDAPALRADRFGGAP